MSIPLALYIHTPWCIRKCPYCDFNSHALRGAVPEQAYITALLADLAQDRQAWPDTREIISIFIGGGTPSLFSPQALAQILGGVASLLPLAADVEITLEANPGAVDRERFAGFRQAGVNRISLGVQSFQDDKLQALGRIHGKQEALTAVMAARQAGFDNINVDIMYGLPGQNVTDALHDLNTALTLPITHLSWYQLTLEPHTAFHHRPPPLPDDDLTWEMQQQGQALLATQGFMPYEISAYARAEHWRCRHNLNYWAFGDYYAIGAGAHGKMSSEGAGTITRYWKTRHPKDYLDPHTPFQAGQQQLAAADLPFEFMLNALRLYQPIPLTWFTQRTGMAISSITTVLDQAQQRGLLHHEGDYLHTTALGKRYLNDLLQIFL